MHLQIIQLNVKCKDLELYETCAITINNFKVEEIFGKKHTDGCLHFLLLPCHQNLYIPSSEKKWDCSVYSLCYLPSPGCVGPMIEDTIDLGISLLRGGNIDVQKVRLFPNFLLNVNIVIDVAADLIFTLC